MLHRLTQFITTDFAQLLDKIVIVGKPEKIFLLSVCQQKHCTHSIFNSCISEQPTITSSLLLVLVKENGKSCCELQDKIESLATGDLPVTAIVLPFEEFSNWLIAGHPFANRVYTEGLLCYEDVQTPLPFPCCQEQAITRAELFQELDRRVYLSTEFMSGVELFIIRKNYSLAAFHLHQAAEQALAAMIHFISGWKVQTHNLDKLYRYCQFFFPPLVALCPRYTENDKRLFQLLQKAYADVRYKKDYSIKYPELIQLCERVKKILEKCRNLDYSMLTIS